MLYDTTFKNRTFYGNYESSTLFNKKQGKQVEVAHYLKSVFYTKMSPVKIYVNYKNIFKGIIFQGA